MATWREFDSFETRTHRVGGEMAEMAEYAAKAGATDDQMAALREATRNLADVMRQVRNEIRDAATAARGHRR